MKAIIELTRAIQQDQQYFQRQFMAEQISRRNPRQVNVLFINPQLSGKHLYKLFLPFFALSGNPNIKTAIQHISKYNTRQQLVNAKTTDLPENMITWANYIIFPFTSQPLATSLYTRIRKLNPTSTIIFQIDFNYYEISQKHPLYDLFSDDILRDAVEDNAFFADTILVSNTALHGYLIQKFTDLCQNKYLGKLSNPVKGKMAEIFCLPLFINAELMTANVENYQAQQLIKIVGNPAELPGAPVVQQPVVTPIVEQSPALEKKLTDISQSNQQVVYQHRTEQTVEQAQLLKQRANEKQQKIKKIKKAAAKIKPQPKSKRKK